MSLATLPAELLLIVARYLLYCFTCHCYHITPHLSFLSRSNRRLHDLLGPYLLRNSSALHMLLWAISHTRHDTLSLALSLGADPSAHLPPLGSTGTMRLLHLGTPVDIAIAMRMSSLTAISHSRHLGTIALLLASGGIASIHGLAAPTRIGDLEVLALCLPHLPDIKSEPWRLMRPPLLVIAARQGHVCAVQMLIRAGACVHSTDARGFPPLWRCWDTPVAVMQLFLDAGSDPTWRDPDGESLVQYIRRMSAGGPDKSDTIDLLLRYGAVDEPPVPGVIAQILIERRQRPAEYTGWMSGGVIPRVPEPTWMGARNTEGCGCPVCPPAATGRGCSVRRMLGR